MRIKEYITPPILLIIVLLLISLIIIFPVLNMILLGAILAYGVRAVSVKIQSKIRFASISIILAMMVVLIPLILLAAYVIFESSALIAGIISSNAAIDIDQIIAQINMYLPFTLDSTAITSSLHSIANYILNYSVTIVGKFANIILDLFILVCSVFYFARDGENLIGYIKSFIPNEYCDFFDNTLENIKSVLKSIFYGHFLTSLIIGIFGCIGYSLLGYPFGIFFGVLTGILQLIPVFGPWPIYWILFFTDLISANYPRAIVVLLFGFFLSTIDMYIRPALSSHHADIHPLILLVGFLSGPLVYGIVGFIVGPMILGITYAIIDSYRNEFLSKGD